MRLMLRIAGLVFLALGMILLVADGARMLGANAFVATPLEESLEGLFPGALASLHDTVHTYAHPLLWDPAMTTLLSWPGWAVSGGLGIALLFLGRRRRSARFLAEDRI